MRRYRSPRVAWDEFRRDLAAVLHAAFEAHGLVRMENVLDLERAIELLSPMDQELFRLIYIEQLDPDESSRRRGVERPAFDAQKTRLLKRLKNILTPKDDRP